MSLFVFLLVFVFWFLFSVNYNLGYPFSKICYRWLQADLRYSLFIDKMSGMRGGGGYSAEGRKEEEIHMH